MQPVKHSFRFADLRRGSRHERGYGREWDKLRDRVMLRDCGLCQPCKQAGRITAARAVDHIVNKASGGTDEYTNLQAICNPCHEAKTEAERLAALGAVPRPSAACGADGLPTDPRHPWAGVQGGGVQKSGAHAAGTDPLPQFAKCRNGQGGPFSG